MVGAIGHQSYDNDLSMTSEQINRKGAMEAMRNSIDMDSLLSGGKKRKVTKGGKAINQRQRERSSLNRSEDSLIQHPKGSFKYQQDANRLNAINESNDSEDEYEQKRQRKKSKKQKGNKNKKDKTSNKKTPGFAKEDDKANKEESKQYSSDNEDDDEQQNQNDEDDDIFDAYANKKKKREEIDIMTEDTIPVKQKKKEANEHAK